MRESERHFRLVDMDGEDAIRGMGRSVAGGGREKPGMTKARPTVTWRAAVTDQRRCQRHFMRFINKHFEKVYS